MGNFYQFLNIPARIDTISFWQSVKNSRREPSGSGEPLAPVILCRRVTMLLRGGKEENNVIPPHTLVTGVVMNHRGGEHLIF
jgi:hypothetical protein